MSENNQEQEIQEVRGFVRSVLDISTIEQAVSAALAVSLSGTQIIQSISSEDKLEDFIKKMFARIKSETIKKVKRLLAGETVEQLLNVK